MVSPGPATSHASSAPRRGWLGRWIGTVERAPGPSAVHYALLWLGLFLLLSALSWLDGTYPFGTLHLSHADFTFWGIYILAVAHHLTIFAGKVFDRARPLLIGVADPDALRLRLTTPSPRWTLVASVVGVGWGVFAFMLDSDYIAAHLLYRSPAATVLEVALLAAYSFISGAVTVYVVQQLIVVRKIYRHVDIDLFASRGLYGFAQLTSRTAVAILFINYLFLFTGSNLLDSGIILGSTVAFSLLSLFLFLWPLWGAHRLLADEKERWRAELDERFTDAVRRLERAIDAGELEVMEPLNKAMSSLEIARGRVDRASTWPWHVETPRLVATAIVVPIGLYLVQRLLERLLF